MATDGISVTLGCAICFDSGGHASTIQGILLSCATIHGESKNSPRTVAQALYAIALSHLIPPSESLVCQGNVTSVQPTERMKYTYQVFQR